jgi:hypothetical protein
MDEKYIKQYIESIDSGNVVIQNISEKDTYISVLYLSPFFGAWNQTSSIDINKEVLKQFIRDKKINDIL